MVYKQRVSQHLQSLSDNGMTQREVAAHLGVPSHNFISMVGNLKQEALLPVTHLPALQRLCAFDDEEALRLFQMRVVDAPERPFQLDEATLKWLLGCTVRVVDKRRGSRGSHGSH